MLARGEGRRSFPQNSTVDGAERWSNLQLDEVALPIVLAWQLGRTDESLYRDHIKKAADFIVELRGCAVHPQERWENQSGYSPGTIAAEIAGLVCAADIARANGDDESAELYERTADSWQDYGGGLDRNLDRSLLALPALPAADQERQAELRHHLQHRRQRADRRRAQGRGSELPRARAAGRQAGGRRGRSRTPSAWWTRSSAAGDAKRPLLLAPLQLRRLRRAEGRLGVGHRLPAEPDRDLGEQRDHRAQLADLRR